MEFEKFNCFFVDFLRYSFGKIKVISTVGEREYTADLVFHSIIEQKMEFEKFNCFFVDFLRYSFGKIKVISTVGEREYTADITDLFCISIYWFLHDKRFY